ncbi:uncharacterized protein EI90DRAFT_3292775 [Cantharellus anzutake]|uniref:uncharacterized protein n=1 Tax=Cantharellus anzutake TaxID=1750568 RepID=UPI00190588CB|nr:uncharacterized protein EI90DRAFT_3292775 [Cantharellus anzutake]KAF8320974.1 hypothetical protein EI90DRAFT_3292775 [Cantharellus anzutake]
MTTQDDEPIKKAPKPIRRLEQSLINRIAAGEIIQRPSSALKELIENALDAGAKQIRVTVKEGGLKLLQIQDDGCGIRKADLPILCERYTTSKISKFSDLASIHTYGFRGEALASISHVAHLTVTTKTELDPCAWRVSYSDGRPVSSSPSSSQPRSSQLPSASSSSSSQPAPSQEDIINNTNIIKPYAGTNGTTLTVEDLFYNTPTRLSALRSSSSSVSEEYGRILDVVMRYAVHNPNVGFSCKKGAGGVGSVPDISTPGEGTSGSGRSASVEGAIKLVYGGNVGRELMHVKTSSEDGDKSSRKRKRSGDAGGDEEDGDGGEEEEGEDDMMRDTGDEDDLPPLKSRTTWSAEIYATSVNYHSKKITFLLFINHRLVESTRIKRAVEAVYASILQKGSYPFVYLSLEIDPASVDVNVHPTKREVHFLDEDKITEAVMDKLQAALTVRNDSRTFEYQTLLTRGGRDVDGVQQLQLRDRGPKFRMQDEEEQREQISSPLKTPASKPYPHHKVRGVTAQDRTLDSMFLPTSHPSHQSQTPAKPTPSSSSSAAVASSQSKGTPRDIDADSSEEDDNEDPLLEDVVTQTQNTTRGRTGKEREMVRIQDSKCFLQSVMEMRAEIKKAGHERLHDILSNHTPVGIVDLERCLALIQHTTNLYMVDYGALSEELFYQLGVRQFGDFGKLLLEPPPEVQTLIQLAVDCETTVEKSGMTKEQVVQAIVGLLMDQREMLQEYFSLIINEKGLLESIPMLLKDYTPNLDRLPSFLMRLGPQVNWTSEKDCFETFLRELAFFYSAGFAPPPPASSSPSSADNMDVDGGHGDGGSDDLMQEEKAERWQIEHVLMPAIRDYLIPPKSLLGSVGPQGVKGKMGDVQSGSAVVQVASLPDLYRVFERC